MFVLSRRRDQALTIGDSITITVIKTGPDKVRLGIEAPRDLAILRDDAIVRHPPGDLIFCPACLHCDTLDGFDTVGACRDNVFCQLCNTEFDPATGAIHAFDPDRNACCREAIEKPLDPE